MGALQRRIAAVLGAAPALDDPETEGGAAGEGRPELSGLSCSTRLVVRGSAATDTVLRTAAASVLSIPVLTWALSGSVRRERPWLAFYQELAEAADPQAAFPAPSAGVRVTPLPAPRFAFRPPAGRVEMLRFQSPFAAINPAVRDSYAAFSENHTAWAQRWCHDDGPRPTLCVIHGFGASPYWLNSAFFNLPWLYRQGYDILLYVLPFHGERQPKSVPFSGWGLFAHGLAHLNEAIFQAVCDFRVFVDYLMAQGVGQVAVTGLSLGGYVAALSAEVDGRLALSIPNAPVVSIGPLIRQWFPANLLVAGGAQLAGVGREELDQALAAHSPLTYKPLIAPERRMIIGGLADRLAPPEQSRMLWEHWDHCHLHWFPGNHVLHFNRGVYLEEMLTFMRGVGVGA
jgi:pimeloyl-ACP methyl ester carboxylesterase